MFPQRVFPVDAEQVCEGAKLGPLLKRCQKHVPLLGSRAGKKDSETWSGSCFLRWDAEEQGMRVVANCSVISRET